MMVKCPMCVCVSVCMCSWFCVFECTSWSTLPIRAKEALAQWSVFLCQKNTSTHLLNSTDANNLFFFFFLNKIPHTSFFFFSFFLLIRKQMSPMTNWLILLKRSNTVFNSIFWLVLLNKRKIICAIQRCSFCCFYFCACEVWLTHPHNQP